MDDMTKDALKAALGNLKQHARSAKAKKFSDLRINKREKPEDPADATVEVDEHTVQVSPSDHATDAAEGMDSAPEQLRPEHGLKGAANAPEMEVGPVEGGLTLDGIMHTKGNSGKEMAADKSLTGELSDEELHEIMNGAK